jgi:ankyrin repeat protein
VLFKGIDARDWVLRFQPDRYSKYPTEHLDADNSFHVVCKDGDLDFVKAIVERTHININVDDGSGNTPLHWAARYGHLRVVEYLCEQGGDTSLKNNVGKTALHWASDNGGGTLKIMLRGADRIDCLPVMQCLCEQGADKDARDDSGWTPLHLAVFNGHLPMVKYLCEQGADKEARSHRNMTPLILAAKFPALQEYMSAC